MSTDYDTLVIGGGLSGLSCGIHLVNEGKKVLLLEKRKVLGGRTSSWNDNGLEIESGLHRFLGFFNHLPTLLETSNIDISDVVAWEDEIEIKLPDNEPSAVLGLAPLFKPGKTFKEAFLNNDFFPLKEKVKIATFFVKGFTMLKTDSKALDSHTVTSFAKDNGVSDATIHCVLVPLTEGLFFLRPEKYSAYNFFALFAPYIPYLYKTRVGAFKGGMTDVMANPLGEYFKKKGGIIKTDEGIEIILVEDNKVKGVKTKNKTYKADNIVIATSLFQAQQLIMKNLKHSFFNPMLSLHSMPSVTFQIELHEPSMEIDRTTFSPGTIFSAYAEQSRTTFTKSNGRISIILAAPHEYVKTSPSQIMEKVLTDAKRININLNEKNVMSYRKVTWAHDFYTYKRGSEDLRPPQTTAIAGLFLTGDYTKQQYLSTMEGAVYAGKLAAAAILNR